jgi:hypothetical protein
LGLALFSFSASLQVMLDEYFTFQQRDELERALADDPSLAAGLAPPLAGDHGKRALDLVLAGLARRMSEGATVGAALWPALADALRAARAEQRQRAPNREPRRSP